MSKKIILFLFLLFCTAQTGLTEPVDITDEAQKMYKAHMESVYQIRTVIKTTGKKSAIGSGFQFTPDGYIATNYHVISDAIQRPNQFTIEGIRFDNSVTNLDIIDIDTIHDLAIVKTKEPYPSFLELDDSALDKGTKIFSMGNPYDLGMSIVEGIYNGLMKKTLYRKILFSGALNSGMSGGPALNHEGKVLGINVSTKGNDVSFLVPVTYLMQLFQTTMAEDYEKSPRWDIHIQNQLVQNQKNHINELLAGDWNPLNVGDASVPGEISDSFKCWSDSEDDKTHLYEISYINCFNDDAIFLNTDFVTGSISYKYKWLTSRGLNPIRFYNLYERVFSYHGVFQNAEEKDVQNFECNTDFVKIDDVDSKVSFCARQYKKYPELYDINVSVASVNDNDRGLIAVLNALGLTKASALKFTKKFLEEIHWEK